MNGSGTSLKKLQITRSYSFLEKVEELWNHTHKENSSASTADEAFSYRDWNGECLDRVSVLESNCTKDFPSISNTVVEGNTCSQTHMEGLSTGDDNCEDIGKRLKNLSLISEFETLDGDHKVSFATLLTICGQSAPSTLLDVFSQYCDPNSIIKIGEGTYGEAFEAGATICKIVPIDGDFRVNGEVQKVSAELLEEVLLARLLTV